MLYPALCDVAHARHWHELRCWHSDSWPPWESKIFPNFTGEIEPGQLLANPSEAWKVAWDVASAGSFNFLYSW